MTAVCPTTQFGVPQGVHPREGGLGNDRGVVVAPSPDEGVEASDEDLLGRSTEVPHFLFELPEMGPLCGVRGLDMGFESQRGSVASRAGFIFPDWILPNVEPQEVTPRGPVEGMEGVSNPGFTGLEDQPHAVEPRGRDSLSLPDDLRVPMEDHKVIGHPDHFGLPPQTALEGGKGGSDRGLQPMQSHIHQEWGEDCPLRGTGVRREEFLPVHDTRLEPGLNGLSQGRKGVHRDDATPMPERHVVHRTARIRALWKK